MRIDAPAPQVSLVIKWPQSVPATPVPEQLAEFLVADRLAATWAIEVRSQTLLLAEVNRAGGVVETALLAGPPAIIAAAADGPADWSGAIARQVGQIRAAGVEVSTLQLSAAADKNCERRLHAMGIRAVVSEHGVAGAIRPLPYGLWQFAPRVSSPEARRWPRLFGRSRPLLASSDGAPTVASIDLGRAAAIGSRSWHDVEALVQQAAEAQQAGAVEIVTIAEAAAKLASLNAARPQRSILRAA